VAAQGRGPCPLGGATQRGAGGMRALDVGCRVPTVPAVRLDRSRRSPSSSPSCKPIGRSSQRGDDEAADCDVGHPPGGGNDVRLRRGQNAPTGAGNGPTRSGAKPPRPTR
jgi:hypothetical protein